MTHQDALYGPSGAGEPPSATLGLPPASASTQASFGAAGVCSRCDTLQAAIDAWHQAMCAYERLSGPVTVFKSRQYGAGLYRDLLMAEVRLAILATKEAPGE